MHFSYGNVCLKLLMYCVFTLDSVFKSVPPKGSEPTWQTSMLYSYSVLLICVNETVYLFENLPFFKIHVNRFMARNDSPGANVVSMHVVGEGPGAILWVLRHFLSLISRMLVASSYIGEGNGTPLQYSSLENQMDRGALWAPIHRVTKSKAWLNRHAWRRRMTCW